MSKIYNKYKRKITENLKQQCNIAAACRPKLIEQFLFCFNTNAEIKKLLQRGKAVFFHHDLRLES